ncbi:helix-turn-helix domain-containing protein [Streptomyces sp. SBT349]|uniref:helix-turn-helix domain-containing protein n=1 Tax=Streptomyces sp. SBT349 TaxID=1580539 RepID=UPI00099B5E6F|nr:helix-turn-helix domain-containing protein [Streptomyces sp. SBT349]
MSAVFTDRSEKFVDSQVVGMESSGFLGWGGRPTLMDIPHQHDDLEVNLVTEGGSMLYLFGGIPVEVGPGSVAAFWAAVPHQLVANSVTQAHWIQVPFTTFLGWGLPANVLGRLLSGVPLVAPPSAAMASDAAAFAQWATDLASGNAELRRIALLELEARVRRVALAAPRDPGVSFNVGDPVVHHVIAMVRRIAQRFHEPLTVADVADTARLHPNYAMTQFRKVMGTTIVDYLTRCRLAEARRLLITTALPIGDIASASGFSSVSRFYTAFSSRCGTPPAKYRRDHRHTGVA